VLLGLVAALNEQAVAELTEREDKHGIEIAQSRLNKAEKLLLSQIQSVDSRYRAVIEYNLACSY
jgi:hypothetical protein